MPESPKKNIWTAPEFNYRPKNISWYLKSAIIAILLVVFSLWKQNLLFAIFIIMAEITLVSWAKRHPRNLNFQIDEKGISIDKIKFYPFEELEGFHIKKGDGERGELILKIRTKFNPYIKIVIFNKDIDEIKNFLKKHAEEMEYNESLTDVLFDKIGF